MDKSVIVLTVDSWRADHCGFMGYERDVTPSLDDLAADGLVFENAIAPAATTSGSVPAFLTGYYHEPKLEPGDRTYKEKCQSHLESHRTIPQRFRERGYVTGAFTANPWTSRFYGYDRGFDFFEDFMGDSLSRRFVEDGSSIDPLSNSLLKLVNWWQQQDMLMSWEAFYDDLLAWIDRADRPYFLWLFLVDVHMPYLPPKPFRSQSKLTTYLGNLSLFSGGRNPLFQSMLHDTLVRSYDDTIRYTDEFVRRLVEDLDARGEEPLLAVHSDHGEAFGENGVYGHGNGVSEEQVHVPLVVLNGPKDTITRPFSMRRFPELLEALATDKPIEGATDSVVWARTFDPELLVRGERWRYVWRPESEAVEVRTDGEWIEIDNAELTALGREVKDQALEAERERGRIRGAVDAVTETAAL